MFKMMWENKEFLKINKYFISLRILISVFLEWAEPGERLTAVSHNGRLSLGRSGDAFGGV